MMVVYRHFLRRMTRDRGLMGQSAGFFALAVTVCVFAIGPDAVILSAVLPGLVWALQLLSALLGLSDMLEGEDLDDLLLARTSLPAAMCAKALAHLTATGLPIAVLAPLAVSLLVPGSAALLPCMWLGLALSAASFSAIGLLGAALTLGSRRNAALQALIILPLCVPPLIFGAGAASAAMLDQGWQAPMAFLAAIACASLTLCPFAAAWIIRMKVTSA